MRRKLVAGNWKMNEPQDMWAELRAIEEVALHASVDVAICPPATHIAYAHSVAPSVWIGGQDCHGEEAGAFTGWLSARMLRHAGASMVIVGHSERRAGACETNEAVRAKAWAGIDAGLLPIICVGESLAERESGEHIARVLAQVDGSVPDREASQAIVAYEPIWAIGTGKTATPADVAEMHSAIRARLRANLGSAADEIRILYGGSVKTGNAAELFGLPDVDGALVGGASLSAKDFVPIIEAATEAGRG